MTTEVNFKSGERFLRGLDINCNMVTKTLGPKGGNVFIDNKVTPKFTKDGATISRSIILSDQIEDAGNRIAKNTCDQTLEDAGDGTTTTACLLQAIVHESIKRPENPMFIRESILKSCEKIVKEIEKKSIKIKKEDIKKIALISSENETLATEISTIFKTLGEDAKITIEDSYDLPTHYEIIDGYEAHVGFMSPIFGSEKGKSILKDAPVFVSEKKISTLQDIAPLFAYFDSKGITNGIIVCEDIDNVILGLLVNNKQKRLFNGVVIRAVGDLLKDIEAVTGATRVSDETGVTFQMMGKFVQDANGNTIVDPHFVNKYLGKVKKIESDASSTLFVPMDMKSAQIRANFLEKFAEGERNMYVKEKLEKRISQLRGKVAVLKIGGGDFQREDLKDKADDAIKACRAAFAEGIVEGGGMCFWRIAQDMKVKTAGDEILKKAIVSPLKKICENAGVDYAEISSKFTSFDFKFREKYPVKKIYDQNLDLKKVNIGYDAKNNTFVDMIEEGIIDPAKVERCALVNAVANASQFITGYQNTITEEINEEKK